MKLWIYNYILRHIADLKWKRLWNRNPKWLDEWVAYGHRRDFHPGMVKSGKLTKEDITWAKGIYKP